MNVFVFLVVVTVIDFLKAQDIVEDKTFLEKTEELRPTSINVSRNEAVNNKSLDSVELLNKSINKRLSYLHAIEDDLLHEDWEEQDRPCLRQLLNVIRNVQNSTLWASWIWDSMQFPVGQLYGSRIHLGNYDQCINMPWEDHPELRTQYCLAEIKLSELDPGVPDVDMFGPVEKYIGFKTKHSLSFNKLTWGICAPAICKQESVRKFADAIFKSTHLGQLKTQYDIRVNSEHCQVAGEFRETGLQEYLFLSCTIFLVVITLLCTWYMDFKGAESKSTSNFAKAFYIKSNAQWLTKMEDKSIRSVLGIRLASNFLVAAGHIWLAKNVSGISNAREIDKKWDDSTQCARFNMDVTVDIFFMISGLLLAKCIIERKTQTFNPFIVIVRRYIRLTCLLPVLILVFPIVLLYGDTGPLVKKIINFEVDAWTSNWWRNVLMIGNYGDTSQISYAVLWTLACDFHLFIIGILICWIYQQSRRAGFKIYVVFAAASLIIPVIHGAVYNSGAVVSFDFRITDNYRQYLIGEPAYVRTHLRAGPYFVGLAFGYLMALFQPEKYRNVISKKSSVLAFFLLLALFASLNYLSGVYHVRQYKPLEGAVFSVVRRNSFAALIGFLIIICEYGSLPLVSSTLSWSGLVPLSKLSYGVYLTHLMFILRFSARTRVPLRSDAIDDLLSTFGIMAFTYTISLFMWLFWEAPVVNLFDMIFKRLAGQQNGHMKSNGETNGQLSKASADDENMLMAKTKIN